MNTAEAQLAIALRTAALEAEALATRIEKGQWPGQTVDQLRVLHQALHAGAQPFLLARRNRSAP